MTQSSAAVARGKPTLTPLQAAVVSEAIQDLLYKYALRKLRHEQDAEDLVQTTVEAALRRDDAGTGWTKPPPPVQAFLGSVMNGEVRNKWATAKRRPRLTHGEEADAVSETPNAEDAAVEHEDEIEAEEKKARIKTELRAHFAKKANGRIPLAMLEAAESGIRGRQKLADLIECSVDDIDRARERIQYQLDRLVKAGPGGEAPS